MTFAVHRLVTGNDPSGKSYLVSDACVPTENTDSVNLWLTRPDGAEQSDNIPFFPKCGEVIFKVVHLPPPDPAMTAAQRTAAAQLFFESTGSPTCRGDTSRDPFMHVTPTTDFVMLLSGAISLILDTGEPIPLNPLDTVVQRATSHSWRVTGATPAVLLCVMVGTR